MRRTTFLARSGGPGTRADHGTTFVELLVSIVLLGTAVVAVLVALQASTTASTTDLDHAKAIAWLHDGSDAIFETDRESCTRYTGPGDGDDPTNAAADVLGNWVAKATRVGSSADAAGASTVWGQYKDALATATPPVDWAGAKIEITAIEFLGRPDPNATFFEWDPSYCFEGVQPDANGDGDPEIYRITPFVAQKVTIRVTSPDGDLVKEIDTVKGAR